MLLDKEYRPLEVVELHLNLALHLGDVFSLDNYKHQQYSHLYHVK